MVGDADGDGIIPRHVLVNCSARGRAVATAGGTYGTHGRLGHVCSGQIAINPCLPIKLALKIKDAVYIQGTQQ